MYADPGTTDAEPNEAESANESTSQCTPTNCEDTNDKY